MNFDRLKNRWRSVSLQSYSNPVPSLQHLLSQYRSARFEDFYQGCLQQNVHGQYYLFQREENIKPNPAVWQKKRFPLLSNLKLIAGVGDKTNSKLKNGGYSSIEELLNHPRYGKSSVQFQEALEKESLSVMLSYCRSRIGQNHPDLLCLSTYHSFEQLCFLDIETLGLFNCPLFLIGIARWDGSHIRVSQFLASDFSQEKAVLAACLEEVSRGTILVTYNGDSFDIPFINDRLRLYQLPLIPRSPSYDMLLFARNQWRNQLPDCRLQTVEAHVLGRRRTGDVHGSLVPAYYQAYLSSKNVGPLIPILEHNQLDIISLTELFFAMLHSEK